MLLIKPFQFYKRVPKHELLKAHCRWLFEMQHDLRQKDQVLLHRPEVRQPLLRIHQEETSPLVYHWIPLRSQRCLWVFEQNRSCHLHWKGSHQIWTNRSKIQKNHFHSWIWKSPWYLWRIHWLSDDLAQKERHIQPTTAKIIERNARTQEEWTFEWQSKEKCLLSGGKTKGQPSNLKVVEEWYVWEEKRREEGHRI